MPTAKPVRAIFRAAAVPGAVAPYDRLSIKVYYPACYTGSEAERNSGLLPVDPDQGRMPAVIFMNGINVGSGAYQWLAEGLAAQGLIVLTYDWVAETLPGQVGITPGVDFEAVRYGNFGTKTTCPALPPLLEVLAALNTSAPLAGSIDLGRVVLAGHSGGGTMALQNADPRWVAGIAGVFTYAAHTMASTMLGYPPGTLLPVAPGVPVLLIGGDQDAVIAASRGRYGEGQAADPLQRTFDEAITGGRGDCYWVIMRGAGHFAIAHPVDPTTGRNFLEDAPLQDDPALRANLLAFIVSFINAHVRQIPGTELPQLPDSAAIINRK